ncbi:MAG: serine hydrolase [Cyclobacteriaceae bacterium]
MFRFLMAFVGALLIGCGGSTQTDPVLRSLEYAPLESTPTPVGSNAYLGLAGYAKVFCSAIFVSGRDPEEAFKNSGYFFLPEELQDKVTYSIDTLNKTVTLSLGDSLSRSARFIGDQGSVIETTEGLFFEPVPVNTTLPDPMTLPWPMGDLTDEDLSEEINAQLLSEAVDAAFTPEESLTAAFVVLHKGKIVAERYADGITKDTQLESWSMGKSLTGTLVGRMIQMGYFKLDDKAPVPEWQKEGDPRGEMKIRDLMQMSSGLRFQSHHDANANPKLNEMDHFFIYSGATDAFAYSVNRPLEFPIGSKGQYHNCDPLTLGYIMKTSLGSQEDYLTFPQRELFDKIGIRKQVMEVDPYGNFLLTGFDYGTARNWARLGQLYLQNGKWNGEQILPENWSEFVSTLAPGWEEPVYGGLFWINGTGEMPIPKEAYYMAGAGGQKTIIIPSHDLVVVRLGHHRGDPRGAESLNNALSKLMEAFADKGAQ